ncbi:golgin subfamily B member 1-like isoform X1 [Hypanus sabinus]|uniref:golgin subfamily B member 1-like isoform X1 n=2 Tax=Hypanus sabinus TaxID=79690 RepID=UPI0028C48B40|nr:golgin subfamily B member 1-like isoform X1 [Hypanus sabinus]
MLSRLSDLAKGVNTVLQDLSGEDSGNEINASQRTATSHQSEMETGGEVSEDVMERLAHTEQLVIQLKELVREKDFQLQSKDVQLKEEKELFDARLSKLKLQAKAKVASLNARIEELQKQTLPSTSSQTASTAENVAEVGVEHPLHDEIENLKGQLQKQEDSFRTLQATAEGMKDQLQAASELLKQKEAEHARELLSLREVILEKDSRFQECIQKHEEELVQLASGSEINKELQQTVKSLQRKLEEKEEALVGRTRVVEMLQQELNNCDWEKKVLNKKLQELEDNLSTLQAAFDLEKVSSETRLRELVEKHEIELAEKDRTLMHLQQTLQTALASYDELTAQSQQLQNTVEAREKICQALTDEVKLLKDDLKQIEENKQSEADLISQNETSARIQELEEKVQSLQTAAEEQVVTSQNRLAELEEEKGSLLWRIVDYEEIKTENEHLRARIKELEQHRAVNLAQPTEDSMLAEGTGIKLLETLVEDQATQSGDVSQWVTEKTDKAKNLQEVSEPEQKATEPVEVQQCKAEIEECSETHSLHRIISDDDKEPGSITYQPGVAQTNQLLLNKLDSVLSEDGIVCQISMKDGPQFMPEQQEAMSATDKHFKVYTEQKEVMEERTNSCTKVDSTIVSVQLDKVNSTQVEQRSTTVVHLGHHTYSTTEVYSSGEQLEYSSASHGGLALVLGKEEDSGITRHCPELQGVQSNKSDKLQARIQDLEEELEELKAFYSKQLKDNNEELMGLNQIVLGYKEEIVKANEAIDNLSAEKNELLDQIQKYSEELSLVPQLKEKLTKAEEEAVDEEKKNYLVLENMSMQNSLLQEQFHSAENESRSKDMKIEALERELDIMQHQISEQEVEVKDLRGELKMKKEATLNLKQLVNDDKSKIEELVQKLASKEQELVTMQQALFENVSKVQQLHSCLSEKEREMAEVTMSMSEKMVVLNEEKFSLGNQVKQLKEQALLLQKEPEGKEEEKPSSEPEQPTRSKEQTDLSQSGTGRLELILKERDDLKKHVDNLTKENEQIKRKLQAALIKRKELLKKMEEMKQEAQNKDCEAEESSPSGNEAGCSDLNSSEPVQLCEENQIQNQQSVDLVRALAEKETDLQNVREALQDQEATVGHLQNLVEDLKQKLQKKTDQVNSLEATLLPKQLDNPQAMSQHEMEEKDVENESTEIDSDKVPEPIITVEGSEESKQTLLESKLSVLEQEKDQLQKKLEEAMSLRKDMIKKAQEKNRLHREQVKQQKEQYNALLENFNQQSQEKVRICEELSRVKEQLQLLEEKPAGAEPQPGKLLQENSEEAKDELSERSEHLGWSSELMDTSRTILVQAPVYVSEAKTEDPVVAQLREELEKLHNKNNDLELKLQHLTNPEQRIMEEAAVSQDKIAELEETHCLEKEELIKELDLLKKRYQDTEAHAEDLKLALEVARAGSSDSESMAILSKQYEELKVILHNKDEEIERFYSQLKEKDALFQNLEQTLSVKVDFIKTLQSQMEEQAKEFEDERKLLQNEVLEAQQKQEDDTEEAKLKQQMQRKLQAALISRKETLKVNKSLREELANVTTLKEELNQRLTEMEMAIENLRKDKEDLTTKLLNLKEQKEKLIIEVDKLLIENQNFSASSESLKLIIDGITQEKAILQHEVEFLKSEQKAESSDWHRKHEELQKEYETLLQSYENVSGEIEKMYRVLEIVKQEKQELFGKIQEAEVQKKGVEKQLQEAKEEQEGMKEKMRKFAKSKQQKIMDLEEEIERLQLEQQSEPSMQSKPSESSVLTERRLQEELQKAKQETEEVMKELETLKIQRDFLKGETNTLKLELNEMAEKLENSEKVLAKHQSNIQEQEIKVKEAIDATIVAEVKQGLSNKVGPSVESTKIHGPPGGSEDRSFDNEIKYNQELSQLMEQLKQMENDKQMTENEIYELKKVNQLLQSERDSLEEQLVKNKEEWKQMHRTVSELELDNHQLKQKVELVQKEKTSADLDKDDLEERLMNQLAELNSSVADYQQESKEHNNKISHLELTVREYLKQIGELEEEVRQLKREKAEAAAKLQKDFEQKIKSMQKKYEGGKIHNKELQELLKEQQQEVKQLQKDCIQYQEKISGLGKTIRALEFVQQETQKSLDTAKKETAAQLEDCKKAQAELLSCKVQLDDAQSEVARLLADELKLKEELQTLENKAKEQTTYMEEEQKRRINREKDEHRKELKNMQEKIESLEREKKHSEDTVEALQGTLEKKKEETNQIQANFNENLAKLAAFTRSMSSLQNDRDRIIDESKKWEIKFNDAILKKEEEIRDKENNCSRLRDQLRQITIHHEELKIKLSRMEHSEQEWESKFKIEEENWRQMMQKVQEENGQLFSRSEEFQKLHKDSQNEQLKLSEETKSLKGQIADLNNSLEKLEVTKGDLEKNLSKRETEVQNYMLTCEQLKSNLQNSKALTEKLHEETGEKEEKIVTLLAEKEEAVVSAIADAQQQHAEERGDWERQVKQLAKEKLEGELAIRKLQQETEDLDAKLRQTKEELKQNKVKLESLTKSMASLQNDRERVLSDYKQLEQRHIDVIVEKDQLIQEAATENNKLKNEFRSQQGQRDDLNSENAKLNAQLVRYREDLNQVILLKDSQHKQLEKTQLERIRALENEKAIMETKSKELEQENETLKEEKQKQTEQLQLAEKITDELKNEVENLRNGGPVQMLQKQLDEKLMEVEKLTTDLSSAQEKVAELELKRVEDEEETRHKLIDTKAKYEKELENLHHSAGIMRNETEVAEERVAELAKDLMETEQRLREALENIDQLQGQNRSFGKAMSSLQDNRDDLLVQFEKLQSKYVSDLEVERNRSEELYQELSQSKSQCSELVEENKRLSTELSAWKNNTIEDSLLARIDEMNTQLASKQQVVHELTLELESSAIQLKSFSKTVMALQDERDRLIDEVAKTKKVHEAKQTSPSNPGEVQSLKNALSSLQNDRDRLLKELRSLQQQYMRIGEETAEISQLQAQLESQKHQIANYEVTQEQLKQEYSTCQEELRHLRSEKMSYAAQSERLKEQYLIAVSDKDKQIHELQSMCQEMRLKLMQQGPAEATDLDESLKEDLQSENRQLKGQLNDSLKELHQKELRIQKLNSKLSMVFEEKIALSAQVRATTQNLRDTQQRLSELQLHHATLEHQLLDEEKTEPMVDTAPGAPQEKDRIELQVKETDLKHLKQRLVEAKQVQERTEQELSHLENLLAEEQEKRLAAEEALLSAEHQLKSVELSEWVSAQERNLNASALSEHSLLIDLPESATPSKTRRNSSMRSFCSLFHSRYRTKLLFTLYFIVLHVLFLLCFTGNL